jgi:predicted porin
MKKSFLALAALGSLAGASSAQTNVEIYGLVDAGVSRRDNGTLKSTTLDSGIRNGSRLGFRGSEDLGGGLSAIFRLENGFNADTGQMGQGGRLFGRQAWVGLNGGFGQVRLGRQDNPIHVTLDAIDPFGTGFSGNIEHFFNGYGSRSDNFISYGTPDLGGFNAQLAYAFGEVPGSTSAGRTLGGSVRYVSGPINVALSHHNQNVVATGVAVGNNKTTMVGGFYDFMIAKAHLAFARNDSDRAGATTVDSRDMMVGVSVPVGVGTVLASYLRKDNRLVSSADSNLWALGYIHQLSKRTSVYTSYGRIKNDGAATIGFDGDTVARGADPSWLNVGLQHRF